MDKKFLRLPAAVLFPLHAVYAGVVVLYRALISDIVWQYSIWTSLAELLQFWLEIFGICAIFGFLLAGVHLFGAKNCLPLYLLLGGALLFKYIASVIGLSFLIGSFDATYNWGGYVFSFVLEVALALMCVLRMHRRREQTTADNKRCANASATLGMMFDAGEPFPYRRILSRENSVQCVALRSVLALAVVRLVTFIVEDIAYAILGVPYEAIDFLIMPIYWLMQIILPCAIGYFIALWFAAKGANAKCFDRSHNEE